MTSMLEDQILKTDRRGRVHVPIERREALLAEFEGSGLTGAKFAELAGVKYATFANWRAKRRKARAAGASSVGAQGTVGSLRLIEATIDGTGESARAGAGIALGPAEVVVELPGNARVRADSAAQTLLIAQLLVALEQTRRPAC